MNLMVFRPYDSTSATGLVDPYTGIVDNSLFFRPDQSVTRAEFLKMIVRSLACQYRSVPGESIFVDVSPDSWYAEYVNFAYDKGWIR